LLPVKTGILSEVSSPVEGKGRESLAPVNVFPTGYFQKVDVEDVITKNREVWGNDREEGEPPAIS